MRRRPNAVTEPDESAALLTTALVLALFGVLSIIDAIGWVTTSALFIFAAVACIGGLVLRNAKRN